MRIFVSETHLFHIFPTAMDTYRLNTKILSTAEDADAFFVANSVVEVCENLLFDFGLGDDRCTYRFPENVTLVFLKGTIINGNITLIGNKTSVVAPMIQIFGEQVECKGSWNVERVYPQWFGCKTYADTTDYEKQIISILSDESIAVSEAIADAGEPINKAIRMRHVGEVYLPKGYYVLRTPVELLAGIQLIGDIGMEKSDTEEQSLEASTLLPWLDMVDAAKFEDLRYLVYVNTNSITGEPLTGSDTFLPGQITAIRNIGFCNRFVHAAEGNNLNDKINKAKAQALFFGCGAIFSRSTFAVEKVRFYGFINAVTFSHNTYADCKKIVDCDYAGPQISKSSSGGDSTTRYAFDMGGLGDALLFEHNAIHNQICNKALRVGLCTGGIIRDNIINADCDFASSMNVDFSCNHIEGGHQVAIDTSRIRLHNNFFEIGEEPAISIVSSWPNNDRSVVALQNNSFMFYEGEQGDETLSEYDLCIDKDCIVAIDNCFRYWIRRNLAGKSYPFGIKVKKDSGSPLDDFNTFSYKLSGHGQIKANFNIEKDFIVTKPNSLINGTCMVNEYVPWLIDSDTSTDKKNTDFNTNTYTSIVSDLYTDTNTYTYFYQIIWDLSRTLVADLNGYDDARTVYGDRFKFSNNVLQPEKDQSGVLIQIFEYESDSETLIRLFREGPDGIKYVDVPLCGTNVLYDNGKTVCGYRWQAYIAPTTPSTLCTDYDFLWFKGDIAVAHTTAGENLILGSSDDANSKNN